MLYGAVGGSVQRLASNLVGEGTQCKPLKVDLRYRKTGYTGGTMLLPSVPELTTCPRTCYIHRCFGTRSGPAPRVPDRLSSTTVGPRTVSATSRLLLPRSRPLLRQVLLDGDVVLTAIPIGTRCKAAGLRSRMKYDLRVPACNGRVPAIHGSTVPVPARSCPQTVNWVIQGPSAVSTWLVPRLFHRSAS